MVSAPALLTRAWKDARLWGICPGGRWHASVDDLLAGERPDFVDVCAPPGSHATLIERALDAGLHVVSEKPLVTQVEDAKHLAAAAARAGRVAYCA